MSIVSWSNKKANTITAPVEIVGMFCGKVPTGANDALEEALGKNYLALLKRMKFTGEKNSTLLLDGTKRAVVIVGLGPAKDLTMSSLRSASAVASRACSAYESAVTSLGTTAVSVLEAKEVATALVEGLALGTYSYATYKKSNQKKLKKITIADVTKASTVEQCNASSLVCEGVMWARDMINTPPNEKAPKTLASNIQKLMTGTKVKVQVLDELALKRKKMAGVIAVGQGSVNRPHFVRLSYRVPGAKKTLAFVGKGVIFDSGGLSIKPGDHMTTMKCDMSGAAAVAGAMKAVSDLKLKVNIEGYIPLVENMPSGSAYRVDDIIAYRNGVSVEVQNTDAEGRLILADALIEASQDKPDVIVDLATLTGACVVALGEQIAAAMGNSETFVKRVVDNANSAGERMWHMPLPEDYRELIDTPVANVANAGPRYAGSLTAGLFLKEFVDNSNWCHLDIAGPAFLSKTVGENIEGGTGFGIRTLVSLAKSYV